MEKLRNVIEKVSFYPAHLHEPFTEWNVYASTLVNLHVGYYVVLTDHTPMRDIQWFMCGQIKGDIDEEFKC